MLKTYGRFFRHDDSFGLDHLITLSVGKLSLLKENTDFPISQLPVYRLLIPSNLFPSSFLNFNRSVLAL